MGPTSLVEQARLTGEFADWHNILYRVTWVHGPLDLSALAAAWRDTCRRHDVLRRTFASAEEAHTATDPLSEPAGLRRRRRHRRARHRAAGRRGALRADRLCAVADPGRSA
ncbi:hypothetical protein G5V59_10430 [Nocardioides sp. W3-2-3]|nr:hypothetical protein [Nocardioides convexus]